MLQQFLGDVLPAAGYFCLFLLPEQKHVWAESQDELLSLIESRADRTGVYYGTAAFASMSSRKQANVLSLKALRLDIDAGAKKYARDPEGTYPTQRDALAASVSFFKASALTPTYVISSGEGLHLYWAFEEEVPAADWRPLAQGLAALAARHGLKADSSVTEDSARILRPPGTMHSEDKRVAMLGKNVGPRYDVADLRTRLKLPAPRQFDRSINDELTLGYEGPPSSAMKIAQHCGALREVVDAAGDVSEPHWRAMIGLVKRCTEGIELVHDWSSGYDGYDPAETEKKFDAWTAGPTTCAELSRHSTKCSGCKYNGRIKSPIHLGVMTPEEVEVLPPEKKPAPPAPPAPTGMPWDGLIPAGYDVITTDHGHTLVGTVKVEKTSDTGETVVSTLQVGFSHQVFWFSQWAEADNSHDAAQVTLQLWTGTGVRSYLMDQAIVPSMPKLLEYLGGKSIHTTAHKKAGQVMQEYVKAQLHRIRTAGRRPKVADHLGLRILEDGTLVAAHGKHIINPDGTIEEAMLSSTLAHAASTFRVRLPESQTGEWDRTVWDDTIVPRARRHVEFLRKYYPPGSERFQLAIMLGLASPLMAFATGEFQSGSTLPAMSSLSVSLYSSSSARGKTTAVQQVALAYGNVSEQTKDAGKLGATDLGRIGRLSTFGTMPSIMDEMGGANAGSVASLISAVANGAARVTMRQDRSARVEAPWALINLITTNRSQRDMVSAAGSDSDAIQRRLLEINVADVPEYERELRESFRADWAAVADCEGALGAVIHREIVKLGVEKANSLMARAVSKADKCVQGQQSDRFQYRALGAMIALQALLNKLELAPFSIDPLVDAFKVAHDSARDYIELTVMPSDGLERMVLALNALQPYTLVTETETRTGGKSTKFDVPLNIRFPERIVARHVTCTGRTYVSADALREWCREHGVNELEMTRDARKAGAILTAPGKNGDKRWDKSIEYYNLTKGLKDNMHLRLRCYTIDTRRLAGYTGADLSPDNVVELRPAGQTADQEPAATAV